MAEEEKDFTTGELPPIAETSKAAVAAPIIPAAKKYVVVVEKPKDDPQNRSALAFEDWRGNKGDVLPDNIVAALKAKHAIGAVDNALEHWLHIDWIKEA